MRMLFDSEIYRVGIMSCFASFHILQNRLPPIRQLFCHVLFFPSCQPDTLSVTVTESCVNIPVRDLMKIREALSHNENAFQFRNISCGNHVLLRSLPYSAKPPSPHPSIFLPCSVLPFLLARYPVGHLPSSRRILSHILVLEENALACAGRYA